jgi:biotin transport system substrate-specific component
MFSLSVTKGTLAAVIWPLAGDADFTRRALRNVLLAVLGTAFVAAAAQVQIPLWPVPVTGQTFAVLIVGMVFGMRLGAATLLLYMAEGTLGIPVFAKFAAGPAVIAGPTGGYIIGFVLAAGAIGYLAERGWDRNVVATALAMLAGNVLIYVPGLLWLGSVVGWDKPVLEWGLTPFLLGDALKLALAAALLPLAWKLIRKRGA